MEQGTVGRVVETAGFALPSLYRHVVPPEVLIITCRRSNHRIVRRHGDKRAILTMAHSIVVIIHGLPRKGKVYQGLGTLYFDKRDREYTVRRSIQRIKSLGYKVSLQVA